MRVLKEMILSSFLAQFVALITIFLGLPIGSHGAASIGLDSQMNLILNGSHGHNITMDSNFVLVNGVDLVQALATISLQQQMLMSINTTLVTMGASSAQQQHIIMICKSFWRSNRPSKL